MKPAVITAIGFYKDGGATLVLVCLNSGVAGLVVAKLQGPFSFVDVLCQSHTGRKDTQMKITWKFNDGTVSEVEVNEELGEMILESRRAEHANDERHRYHCNSLDAFDFEGEVFADFNTPESNYLQQIENEKVRSAFSKLTLVQQRRLSMLADGLTYRDIALMEGVSVNAIEVSVNAAKEKMKKYL